jgi:NAD kinase
MAVYEKIVIVTKKTALEELIERFNTREQARFYIERSGDSFDPYQAAHDAYLRALATVKAGLPAGARSQIVDRSFLPNFTFGEQDLVVTLGPDGLVVNTAKYLNGQPLLALNPDPKRVDGILVPFQAGQTRALLPNVLRGAFRRKSVAMAQARLNDGQTLYAVNDLFIGQQAHQSARYRLSMAEDAEDQSSSGVIVSTGAGSTGWFRSVLTGAARIVEACTALEEIKQVEANYRFDWEADYVCYTVREPFISKVSSARMVYGRIESGQQLEIISHMPQNGVIFSDGIAEDHLEFNSGAIARIGLADRRVNLIVAA